MSNCPWKRLRGSPGSAADRHPAISRGARPSRARRPAPFPLPPDWIRPRSTGRRGSHRPSSRVSQFGTGCHTLITRRVDAPAVSPGQMCRLGARPVDSGYPTETDHPRSLTATLRIRVARLQARAQRLATAAAVAIPRAFLRSCRRSAIPFTPTRSSGSPRIAGTGGAELIAAAQRSVPVMTYPLM